MESNSSQADQALLEELRRRRSELRESMVALVLARGGFVRDVEPLVGGRLDVARVRGRLRHGDAEREGHTHENDDQ